jgi:putative ATPase
MLTFGFVMLGRSAINTLEMAIQAVSTIILSDDTVYESQLTSKDTKADKEGVLERLLSAKLTVSGIKTAFQKTHLQYDRQGDEHYNLISALHKSVRGGYVDMHHGGSMTNDLPNVGLATHGLVLF